MRNLVAAAVAVALAAGPFGCEPGAMTLFSARQPGGGGDPQFNVLWQSALDVLTEYRFTVDRADKRAGVMVTQPLLGQQAFEFWRHDAATPFDMAESSLHNIYRQATVSIRHAELSGSPMPQPKYVATVEVKTSRSNSPNPQVNSAADAHRMFLDPSKVQPATDTTRTPPSPAVELGLDRNLAARIQAKINTLAARRLRILAPAEAAGGPPTTVPTMPAPVAPRTAQPTSRP